MHRDLFILLDNIQEEFHNDFPRSRYIIYPKSHIDEYISKGVSCAVHLEPYSYHSNIFIPIYYIDKESGYFIARQSYDIEEKTWNGLLVKTIEDVKEVILNILDDIKSTSFQ